MKMTRQIIEEGMNKRRLPGVGGTGYNLNTEKIHLITGAAGFIGYFISKRLLKKGFGVVGLDICTRYHDSQKNR